MPKTHLGYLAPYQIDKEVFIAEYEKIRRDRWPIQISCYLKEPRSIYPFIDDPQMLFGNDFCSKQWLRMDILPDGTVTPCVQFPDMTVGDLTMDALPTVWNSAEYKTFRRIINQEPLPVCSKCNNIYLYDAKRKYL
jgi:radical SAM protein with 4Fe4S-binding SPASM domain